MLMQRSRGLILFRYIFKSLIDQDATWVHVLRLGSNFMSSCNLVLVVKHYDHVSVANSARIVCSRDVDVFLWIGLLV